MNFDDLLDTVMECESGADHVCAECLKRTTTIYGYMSETNGILCTNPSTTKVKKLIKGVDTTTEITKMKVSWNKTVTSVETFMDDFFYFMNGTEVKGNAASQKIEDCNFGNCNQ